MHLARLGDESVERSGKYTALHFEGRDLTNVDQQLAAKVEGWSGPLILVGGHWDEWLARESDAFATVERADGDLAVYTSGTTGRPKGVALSHANLAATRARPPASTSWTASGGTSASCRFRTRTDFERPRFGPRGPKKNCARRLPAAAFVPFRYTCKR